MKNIFISIIAFALVLSACSKDKSDIEKPTITVIAPEANKMMKNGDVMHLEFNITDNIEIGMIHVMILKNGVEDFHDHVVVNDRSYTYHEHYTISVTEHTDIILKVVAEDKEGNKAEAVRNFHIHP